MPIVNLGLVKFEDDLCVPTCYYYDKLVKYIYCKKYWMYLEETDNDRLKRCKHCIAEHGFRNAAESQPVIDPAVVEQKAQEILNLQL